MSFTSQVHRIIVALLVAGCLAWPQPAGAQAAATDKTEKAGSSSQSLLQAFESARIELQEGLKVWASREAAATDKRAQTEKAHDQLQVAVASLKATLFLQKLPLPRVQELLAAYTDRDKDLKNTLKELSQEIDDLKQKQQSHLEEQNGLRMQLDVIQAKDPQALSPEIQAEFLNYLGLTRERDALLARVLERLEQRRGFLQQEQDLLAGLRPQLKHLEEAWKAELLKRPAEAVPIWEQIHRVWRNLATVPARGLEWLADLVNSGRLSAFIWRHLAPILGLFILVLLLGWSTRRLNNLLNRRLRDWREETEDLHLLPLYALGQTLMGGLFGLGLIFWVGLFLWTFGLLRSDPGQLILAGLATLWVLRLGFQTIPRFFAGQAGGGVLDLPPDVARYYRRSLQLLLLYLSLGFFGLKSAGLLDFPESSRLFLEHYFLTGVLVWGWWLLRRSYLTRLLPALADPSWLHRPWVSLFLRGLVLFVLVVIILADLLGFQNLAFYLSQAAAWTLMAAALLWFLWLAGEIVLRRLLHPEAGRASYRFPDKAELIQRVYTLSRWVLSLTLTMTIILWSLDSWGITPAQAAWAFRWLSWGPTLGPVKLSILSVAGVCLTLYLGFFLSRLVRGLMMVRIFPRTALDPGLQYTISTVLHYVILVLAVLIALNILGFPLTSLVLVFGALGVGIGFGLQNIVNNFLSGLILLFERPIKVGDMLVIDGQWGRVKEIRVRSTVFETFDRCVVIIPNSELVSSKVLNWTHYGEGINRITLKVGVSYGADVEQVREILLDICRANPRVVSEPPPQVFFTVYGDSSLDFTIWVHLWTPSDRMPATHELNRAIFETFNAKGIEMPVPQRDLHIKEWPQALEKKEGG
jgi:potassium-dependent mechanosensitive channel